MRLPATTTVPPASDATSSAIAQGPRNYLAWSTAARRLLWTALAQDIEGSPASASVSPERYGVMATFRTPSRW